MRLQFISGNNKLFLKITFGAKGSKIELFWGGFGYDNKKLSSKIILVSRGVAMCCFGWYTKAKSSTF